MNYAPGIKIYIKQLQQMAKGLVPAGSFVGSSGQAARKGQQPRDFVLMEGEGWKLGYDRNPINTVAYTALIGADSWSVSVTMEEFTDFLQVSCI